MKYPTHITSHWRLMNWGASFLSGAALLALLNIVANTPDPDGVLTALSVSMNLCAAGLVAGAFGDGVTTYDGPTRVIGERALALYFAVVTTTGGGKAPTFWELTPGFAPRCGTLWHVQEHGCRLETVIRSTAFRAHGRQLRAASPRATRTSKPC